MASFLKFSTVWYSNIHVFAVIPVCICETFLIKFIYIKAVGNLQRRATLILFATAG